MEGCVPKIKVWTGTGSLLLERRPDQSGSKELVGGAEFLCSLLLGRLAAFFFSGVGVTAETVRLARNGL